MTATANKPTRRALVRFTCAACPIWCPAGRRGRTVSLNLVISLVSSAVRQSPRSRLIACRAARPVLLERLVVLEHGRSCGLDRPSGDPQPRGPSYS
jgi:hypothetical protein